MTETVQLKYDFYDKFDRMGEGVLYYYTIEFDKERILVDDITEENFKVIPGYVDESTKKYLRDYCIDPQDWCNAAYADLIDYCNEKAVEQFFEELDLPWFIQYFEKFCP